MENQELNTKKKAVDLAVAAGRKRQSPRTGFVHHFPGDETAEDTIPLFENFCFALALFRQKSVESMLEGKEIVKRLLAFQNEEGNFPIYLHDYPRSYDPWMGLKIAPALVQILRHFGSGIGLEMKDKILSALERLIQFSATRSRPPIWEHRFQMLKGNVTPFFPVSAEDWFHWLATEQIGNSSLAEIPYQPGLQVFLGGPEVQEKGEPRPHPLEWTLSEKEGFSERLLRDHPAMISSALLFPAIEMKTLPSASSRFIPNQEAWPLKAGSSHTECEAGCESQPRLTSGGIRLLWGGNKLHSFSIPHGRFICSKTNFSVHSFIDPETVEFDLENPVIIENGDLIEAAAYVDLSTETEVLIGGKKGTVFALGDLIQIRTPLLQIELCFDLIRGQGDFCGQISRANRPTQIACKGPLLYEAYDWRIALRTLRRSSHCLIAIHFTRSL